MPDHQRIPECRPATSEQAGSRAEADLRRILALAKVPRRCIAETPKGKLALSPTIGNRIIARLGCYKRPLTLVAEIEAAMQRWAKLHPRPATSAP